MKRSGVQFGKLTLALERWSEKGDTMCKETIRGPERL